MTNIQNYYEFYFKEVYTVQHKYYRFDPDISMNKFIEEVKLKARIDFNLRKDEVIEAGQFNNINGRDAELAPALEPFDSKLREKYSDRVNSVAFYIRRFTNTINKFKYIDI
jgi:hypothetical protein